jgi:ATP-dependent NAD(P)H-hydrate dehydratase
MPDRTMQEIIESITSVFPRIHVLVVGPGLSRDKLMLDCAKGVIAHAREKGMPMVIDADGLFLIGDHPELVMGYSNAVLTPNLVEFKRLCERLKLDPDACNDSDMTLKLSQAFGGVTILQKGFTDIISNGKDVSKNESDGGLKRVGGQGDILTGVVATFLAWGKVYMDNTEDPNMIEKTNIPMLASWGGSRIARECSRVAYQKHERAMLTSDMIAEVGPAFKRIFSRASE